MYGTQAKRYGIEKRSSFENDVKMYGTQAESGTDNMRYMFENDVKMYGTQALNLKALLDG